MTNLPFGTRFYESIFEAIRAGYLVYDRMAEGTLLRKRTSRGDWLYAYVPNPVRSAILER